MAKRIPQRVIDEVLSRVPITQVIGDYVKLQRKGNRLVALCPFHDEKTPSFSVNGERGVYHCFGCGASGNTVSFLMQHDGLSFREAMESLAGRAGVALPMEEEDPARARANRDERETYFEATSFAREFYARALWSGRWETPLRYLEERGISKEVAERFELGYAPPEWSALVDAAGVAGLRPAALEAAGLASQRRSGTGHVDRFRDRVMFPVHDLSRKVLAFSGRTLDPEERAKYINSPETQWYTKGRVLFGLPFAQRSIRDRDEVVLVEGNFDVVSLHAHGVERACAALGTALTEEQARLLRRFGDRVVLLYDGDAAGEKAARRALEVLLAVGAPDIRVVQLEPGRDPDDVVRSEGGEALEALIARARPMVDVLLDEAIAPAAGASDPTTRRAAATEAAEVLRHVGDRMMLDAWVADVSRRLQVDARRLHGYIRKLAGRGRSEATPAREPASGESFPSLSAHESMLVEALADEPDLLGRLHREELHLVLPHAELSSFLGEVSRRWAEEGGSDLRTAIDNLPGDAPLREALLGVLAGESHIRKAERERVFAEVSLQLKRAWLDREMEATREALRQLGPEASEEEMAELMVRSGDLMAWRQRLDPQRGET